MVFVHYCDGTSHSSAADAPVPVAPLQPLADSRHPWYAPPPAAVSHVWFRGRANLNAVTSYLLTAEGMSRAKAIILTGGSAGATTAFVGADAFRALVPAAIPVVTAPDAGACVRALRLACEALHPPPCITHATPHTTHRLLFG